MPQSPTSPSLESTLSKHFCHPEKNIIAALRASDFDLVMKIPIKAYWMRKEILLERTEDNDAST